MITNKNICMYSDIYKTENPNALKNYTVQLPAVVCNFLHKKKISGYHPSKHCDRDGDY